MNLGLENRPGAEETATYPTTFSAPTTIVEDQGWVIGSNGEAILTASGPTITPYSPGLTLTSCHGS